MTNWARLKQETHIWIEVTRKRQGSILVDPYQPLYTNKMCIAGSGVADVQSDRPFRILVANFSD